MSAGTEEVAEQGDGAEDEEDLGCCCCGEGEDTDELLMLLLLLGKDEDEDEDGCVASLGHVLPSALETLVSAPGCASFAPLGAEL